MTQNGQAFARQAVLNESLACSHQYMLDYMRDFHDVYTRRNIPTFSFSFLTEVSHADNNPAQYVDQDLVDAIETLRKNKVFILKKYKVFILARNIWQSTNMFSLLALNCLKLRGVSSLCITCITIIVSWKMFLAFRKMKS